MATTAPTSKGDKKGGGEEAARSLQHVTWPLLPLMLRSSFPATDFDGNGHQGSKGSGCGTPPFHGFSSKPTELRGLGKYIACAKTVVSERKPASEGPGAARG